MNKTLNSGLKIINKDFKHILEFGVNGGKTINQIRNFLTSDYKVFGFDSFIGLPEDWVGTRHKKGEMSTNGIIPDVQNVIFYKGWFKDTIPQYLNQAKPIALLHIDCDLYSSTIDVLYGLKDFIVPSTVLVFDEWYYNHRDIPENRLHEQRAFFEWTKDLNIKYQIMNQIEDERRIIKIL